MIHYEEFTLDNGLQVLVHEDHSTPMVAVNIVYDVGSRDESPEQTGFAHLFEHLMFSGSKNIADYDYHVQVSGGESNAFTSPDITNYYVSLPACNIETAFWLESDRMMQMNFNENSLEVQRKVVIEEFKQRYLNQPYGDVWLKLRPVCYQKHPYAWPTIGKEISHVEQVTLEDVLAFYDKFYYPANAILSVSGGIKTAKVKELAKKWFEPIPSKKKRIRNLTPEPPQTEARKLTVKANVPLDSIFKAYHMSDKLSDDYLRADLLSDILGRGKSSRLYKRLVKETKVFSSISSYVTGSFDPGLFLISGKIKKGESMQTAEELIEEGVAQIKQEMVEAHELEKLKNQAEAGLIFSEMDILNTAMFLGYSKVLGDAELINTELSKIQKITKEDVHKVANKILKPENCTTMYYLKE